MLSPCKILHPIADLMFVQINRKILPAFYTLLLLPPTSIDQNPDTTALSQHTLLASTLQTAITALVNASHASGPFFLGDEISFVDVAFAPWVIRLSRVLSHYRNFPRPDIGTRWQMWVDAIEADERVRNTTSEERSYHNVYQMVGECGVRALGDEKVMAEMSYAKRIVREEGFGLGGDVWGRQTDGE